MQSLCSQIENVWERMLSKGASTTTEVGVFNFISCLNQTGRRQQIEGMKR